MARPELTEDEAALHSATALVPAGGPARTTPRRRWACGVPHARLLGPVYSPAWPERQPRIHCWLLPPLQVQISTAVPLAVPAPLTSRHSPDPTPVIVPSAFARHCWPVPPLQVRIRARVPAEVLG